MSIQDSRNTVHDDIERLFIATLSEHETSRKWYEADSSIVKRLALQSEGLFIYARTAIDFILHDPDDELSMQERYHLLLSTEVAAGRAPLDLLYRTVLYSVFPSQDRYDQMQDRLKRVLGYLVTLQGDKGISPRTLAKLTLMPTAESIPILNKLRSVVIFEHNNVDSRFQIIHATFREFQVGDPTRAGNDFYVNAEEAHGRLAEECTSAMRSFAAQYRQGAGTDAQAMLILQFLTDDPTLSHFVYACQFRHEHLGLSALSQVPENRQSIGEDDPPPIPAFTSFYIGSFRLMCDLISTIVTQLRGSLPAGSKSTDTLTAMEDSLSKDNLSVSSHLKDIVSIILDIQALGNCAVSETAHGQTTRTLAALEDQWVLKLTSILKTVANTIEYDNALYKAHHNFHVSEHLVYPAFKHV
ncbi:hypothetical protein OH76DRAFT_1483013 [Lentinus brumalis]|uniref:Uncharacterized protein n=1 Tax=Lentinus brumalis TaxID=2498619 RepID=A0A371DAV3_9APHY|nr:hypothetical protein OH76DRAFT_1483013 [Polyporus brumalis]